MFSFQSFLVVASIVTATTALSSTSVCSTLSCNMDNCYNHMQHLPTGSAYCATYTTASVTTTAGFDPTMQSCGPTRVSSACSCVFGPTGTQASITPCTTVPLAPSPTAFSYDFSSYNPLLGVSGVDNLKIGVVQDAANAHSPSAVYEFTWNVPQGNQGNLHFGNVALNGTWSPQVSYTASGWAKCFSTKNCCIFLTVYGFQTWAGFNEQNEYTTNPIGTSQCFVLSSTYSKFSYTFNTGATWDYAIYYLAEVSNDPNNPNINPIVYLDDLTLVQN
jgi:hypothetical protein